MPCIIVTGHPAAGKTTAARLLRDRALKHDAIDEVILLNEESECGCHDELNNDDDDDTGKATAPAPTTSTSTKQSCYETALAEKETRGTLKSAFDRAVGATTMTQQKRKRRLIILDSLNYIKGFRYELHCISKAAGETHGVLWVLNKPDLVKDWNNKRRQEQGHGYSPELLQELILRYEPPDERNRWDRPLFTVDMASQSKQSSNEEQRIEPSNTSTTNKSAGAAATTTSKSDVLQQSVYNMHGLGDVLGSNDGPSSSSSFATVDKSNTNESPQPGEAQQQQQQQPSKPTKSAFKRAPKKSAFQRTTKANKPPKVKEQHAFTPDDLKALETTERSATKEGGLIGEASAPAAQLDPSTNKPNNNSNTASESAPVPATTIEEQLDQILDIFLLQTKALKEGISTRQHVAGQANVLQNLDWISAQLISTIATASASQQGSASPTLTLTFHGTGETTKTNYSNKSLSSMSMKCMRPVALPELRRLRKMYLQWVANHPPNDTTEFGIAQSFVQYIEEHLR